MTTLLGRLTAGLASKLNLATDLFALAGALVASAAIESRGAPELHAPFAWLVLCAIALWTITATVLRHYAPNAVGREPMDDAALVSVLVLSSVAVLGLASLLLPR